MVQDATDIVKMFKTAAQTEKLRLKDGSFPPFILPEEIKTTEYVKQTLLPLITDIRSRQIVWLRSQGMCWKGVAKEVGLTESQSKRVFKLSMPSIAKNNPYKKTKGFNSSLKKKR